MAPIPNAPFRRVPPTTNATTRRVGDRTLRRRGGRPPGVHSGPDRQRLSV